MRIAVVENDVDVAYLMQVLLERHDHEVLTFTDPAAAQEDPEVWSDVDIAIIDFYFDTSATGADVVLWLNSATSFRGRTMVVTGVPHLWRERASDDPDLSVDLVLGKVFHTEDFLRAVNLLSGERVDG